MKSKLLWALLSAVAILPAKAADERINVGDLPSAVQKTIEASRGQDPVKEVFRRSVSGRTIYDVELEKNNAPNPHLQVAEDGTRVYNPVGFVGTVDGLPIEAGVSAAALYPKLQLADLPAAVQETIRREAGDREIADIDRETWKDRSVYEVEFAQRGLNTRIHVADDGTLIRDERPRRSLKSLFMGTQIEDTPMEVQQTIRRLAGDREILDVDKKGSTTEPIYRVEIRDGEAVQELRIATDGKVIHDSRSPSHRG